MTRASDQRTAAFALFDRQHGVREVARILGLPKSTVSDWRRQWAAQTIADGRPPASSARGHALAKAIGFDEGGPVADGPDDQEQTGVMVAFFLPDQLAGRLALDPEREPTASPREELHVTLAYLGDLQPETAAQLRFPADQAGRLRRVVGGFAAVAAPLDAQVSGLGRFAVGDRALYASVDAPRLPAWRQRLIEHLKLSGFTPSELHGFTPHVTLAYPEQAPPLDALEIEPASFRFDTLSVAIGGERTDFPLEGTYTFASSSDRSAVRDTARPHPDQEESDQDIQDGMEEAQHAGVDKARDVAQLIGPGEPLPWPAGGHEEGLEPIPLDAPPIIDKLQIQAIRRYANMLKGDVPHHRALAAVKRIDPDFTISDGHARRMIHALGKGEEPVAFGWSAGSVKPPPHVTGVYDEFEMSGDQVGSLSDYLVGLATESYLEGVNAQLITLGLPLEGAITDPGVLADLAAEGRQIAEGIAETYHRDLAAEVYATWIEQRSTLGRQSSRTLLSDAVERWALGRAESRAGMIALTEVGRFYNRGVTDFVERNDGLRVLRAEVTPDECQCAACLNLVAGNPYTAREMGTISLPLHPHCCHIWTVVWEPAGSGALDGLWAAQEAA